MLVLRLLPWLLQLLLIRGLRLLPGRPRHALRSIAALAAVAVLSHLVLCRVRLTSGGCCSNNVNVRRLAVQRAAVPVAGQRDGRRHLLHRQQQWRRVMGCRAHGTVCMSRAPMHAAVGRILLQVLQVLHAGVNNRWPPMMRLRLRLLVRLPARSTGLARAPLRQLGMWPLLHLPFPLLLPALPWPVRCGA